MHHARQTIRQYPMLAIFPPIKGLVMAGVTLAIIKSSLGSFWQALAIAAVSATIGAAGIVIAAQIAAKAQRKVVEEGREHHEDLKQAVTEVKEIVENGTGAKE